MVFMLNDNKYPNSLMTGQPNGERYPLVGGTRKRRFAGTNSKPHKLLENAQTPTSRAHAVLGGFLLELRLSCVKSISTSACIYLQYAIHGPTR